MCAACLGQVRWPPRDPCSRMQHPCSVHARCNLHGGGECRIAPLLLKAPLSAAGEQQRMQKTFCACGAWCDLHGGGELGFWWG